MIEKKMFSNTEDLLPVISFNAKASADEKKKHGVREIAEHLDVPKHFLAKILNLNTASLVCFGLNLICLAALWLLPRCQIAI